MPVIRIGLPSLARKAFAGERLDRLASQLLIESVKHSDNAAALMDLATVEQLRGNTQAGLEFQHAALKISRVFKSSHLEEPALKLLVLNAPIAIGGNTPVEFLLENSNIQVIHYYLDMDRQSGDQLPDHDMIFVAAPGDDGDTNHHIREIENFVSRNGLSVVNTPDRIVMLDRDKLPGLLAGIPDLVVPGTARVKADDLENALSNGDSSPRCGVPACRPFVIRPTGSHAGKGLELLSQSSELPAYMTNHPAEEYFISEFVDYCSADGDFRKYRIIFINGKAYPYHMAIGSSWKLWYMNADMGASVSKLREEGIFLHEFENRFGARHADALQQLGEAIGLDYFGIDCAEDARGNLVVFEADNALIVHDMDAAGKFAYKRTPFEILAGKFRDMLLGRFANPATSSAHSKYTQKPVDAPLLM